MKSYYIFITGILCLALSGQTLADLNTGLLAHYPFDGNANDASPNGIHGSVNGATLTHDRFGNTNSAFFFDGIDDYISAEVNINPDIEPVITMTAWVSAGEYDRADPRAPWRQIISHDNGGFGRSFGIDSRAGNGTGWSMFAGSSQVLGGVPVELNQWVFMAVSYNETAGDVKLYVNGTLISHVNATLGSGEDFINIGSNPIFGEFFYGKIDDVRIYNRTLSPLEMKRLNRDIFVIADSVEEYSGVQGQDNWFYGYYIAPFTSEHFILMPEFNNITLSGSSKKWEVNNGVYRTSLNKEGGHPNGIDSSGSFQPVEQWAVRRYISEFTGFVKISGSFKELNTLGDGVTGHINVDGVNIWSHELNDLVGTDSVVGASIRVGVNYEVETEVHEGSIIDFVITPGSASLGLNDHTHFSAVIVPSDEIVVADCSVPGTVTEDLDVYMPSLNYQTAEGVRNLWAEFEFKGTDSEGHFFWGLKDYGFNDEPSP